MKLNIDSLADVRVTITAMLGRSSAPISEILKYAPGTIVPLDVKSDAPVPLLVNGVMIASGDLVATDDEHLALEIREVLTRDAPVAS